MTNEVADEVLDRESASTAVSVLDPIEKIRAGLVELKAQSGPFDLATTAGMKAARNFRALCVKARSALDEAYEKVNRPMLDTQRRARELKASIFADIAALEDPVDQAIKADEERRERERQARVAAEQARIDGIQRRIHAFGSFAVRAMGEHSSVVENLIRELVELEPDKSFAEFEAQAIVAHEQALIGLRDLQTRVLAQEAESARIKAEREQLERDRQAEADRRAEQARVDAEARAEQEREQAEARRVEQERIDADRRAEQARLQAQRDQQEAELAEQRRQQEAAAEAERQRLAAERQQQESAAAAERQRLADQQAEIDRQRAENERIENERREAAEAQARAEREAAEERERQAEAERQRIAAQEQAERDERVRVEAEQLSRLYAAAPRMLSILKAIEASTWFASFDAALAEAIVDTIKQAE